MPRVVECTTPDQFQDAVHAKGSFGQEPAVVVDFGAAWCGPCKLVAPIFDSLSDKYPKLTFLKVDVDQLSEVASSCGIRAMPTFQTYYGGSKQDELTGADPIKLQALIDGLNERANTCSIGPGHKLGSTEDSPAKAAAAQSGGAPEMSAEARRAQMAAAAEARMKAMQQQQQ